MATLARVNSALIVGTESFEADCHTCSAFRGYCVLRNFTPRLVPDEYIIVALSLCIVAAAVDAYAQRPETSLQARLRCCAARDMVCEPKC